MTYLGINFRNTSGYVTDGANDTYCLPENTADVYPTTRGSLTFGVQASLIWNCFNRDDNPVLDSRLAGTAYPTAGGNVFYLDLPNGAGTYRVRLAIGDVANAATRACTIKDGATTLITINNTHGSYELIDASNTVRTWDAWPGSNTAVEVTFSGSVLTVEPGSNFRIAHIAVEHVSGGGSSSVPPNIITPNQGIAFASAARRSI